MPGDRGTLTRRARPAQDKESRRPTAPGSRRPPQVARERKPALAALALLLIVGGALGAVYLVLQNGHRVAAIEVTEQLGAGQQIPLTALREVDIATSGGLSYVPWSAAGQVSRFFAATGIPPGTLLTNSMVAQVNGLASGKSVVGLALKDGQLPDGLQAGDHVNLYQVSDASQSCPGTPGSLLASNAVVLGIGAPPAAASASAVDVRVALDPAAAGAVTCNAANSNVAVAVLPGSPTGAG